MKPRLAFTLIELIISIGLGSIIILTAFASFRSVAAAIATADRLGRENTLMRQGVLAAYEEIDFWQMQDNPNGDPADPILNGQGLRQFDNSGVRNVFFDNNYIPNNGKAGTAYSMRGLPFTPFQSMAAVTDLHDSGLRIFQRAGAAGSDTERGWDPNYHWKASDQRTWFQGDWGSPENGDLRFGRYSLITNVRPSVTLGDPTRISATRDPVSDGPYGLDMRWVDYSSSSGFNTGNYNIGGPVPPLHTWRENQLRGIQACLGNYGLMEYAPANTLFTSQGGDWWYKPPVPPGNIPADPTNATKVVDESMVQLLPGSIWPSMRYRGQKTEISGPIPRSPYIYYENAGIITKGNDRGLNDVIMDHHGYHGRSGLMFSGIGVDVSGTQQYLGQVKNWRRFENKINVREPLMVRKPAQFPDVTVSVERYHTDGHFATACAVRWVNLQTGQLVEVHFNGFGTTLRGARQQRKPGGGWAKWDSSTTRDLNLDDMTP